MGLILVGYAVLAFGLCKLALTSYRFMGNRF